MQNLNGIWRSSMLQERELKLSDANLFDFANSLDSLAVFLLAADAFRKTSLHQAIATERWPIRCREPLMVDEDDKLSFQKGQRVRVKESIKFRHVPGHKEGYEAEGLIGTVVRVYDEPDVSPNRGIKVQFTPGSGSNKAWIAHFEAFELEAVQDESYSNSDVGGGL